MAPGDSWDSEQGFTRADFDWYSERDEHLDELADIAEPAIVRSGYEESERTLTFGEFADFFGRFLKALPPLSGRLAVKRPIAFAIGDVDEDGPYWVVDVRHGRVEETDELPAETASIITVPRGVLADAIANTIVHYVHISMRFHTRLLAGGTGDDLAFWGLLTIWELGYFPTRRMLRPRMLAAGWRRRAELFQAAGRALGRGGSFVDRMSGQLASPSEDEHSRRSARRRGQRQLTPISWSSPSRRGTRRGASLPRPASSTRARRSRPTAHRCRSPPSSSWPRR